jgi:hypothetical protein
MFDGTNGSPIKDYDHQPTIAELQVFDERR